MEKRRGQRNGGRLDIEYHVIGKIKRMAKFRLEDRRLVMCEDSAMYARFARWSYRWVGKEEDEEKRATISCVSADCMKQTEKRNNLVRRSSFTAALIKRSSKILLRCKRKLKWIGSLRVWSSCHLIDSMGFVNLVVRFASKFESVRVRFAGFEPIFGFDSLIDRP